MDMQLPAVYISDENGCLSPRPAGRNPRRSVDLSLIGSNLKTASMASSMLRSSDEGGIKSADMELTNRAGSRSQGQEDASRPNLRKNSQGAGERKNPRQPSHGSGEVLAVQQASKSMDLSGLQRALIINNPAFAKTPLQTEEAKTAPKFGDDTKAAQKFGDDIKAASKPGEHSLLP